MRKLLAPAAIAAAILSTFTLFFTSAPISAAAQPEWYRIEKETVWFYKAPLDTSDNVLFSLEYTYFVKPLSSSGNFFQIQLYDNKNGFAKMTGYVRSSDLEPYADTPAEPIYPEVNLTVTSSTTLKQTPATSGADITAVFSGKTVMFYGKAAEPNWYFVRVDSDFGYLPANRLSSLNIPLHPTPLVPDAPASTDPLPDSNGDNSPGDGSPGLELLLILLICIPALIIVVLLFLPQKNVPTKHSRMQQPAHKPKYLSDGDYFDDMDLL